MAANTPHEYWRNRNFDFTEREQALKAHAERTRAEIDRANNPHEFRVEAIKGGGFIIVNERGNDIGAQLYLSFDQASDAIGEMIADDDADRRLNRHRHEQRGN